MAPLSESEPNFLEIAEDCYNARSTISTNQIAISQWQLGE
jgi:hypothetical protein